ncbi:hypothetical protein BpHYR1_044993 [Brachionus plicatilis]|uniref:Uncharacterized protein n=1 Tax=Brachionus plicatilis TaxID=10195 RepID=A0A3M7RJJ6_BRAPC|nr:hypothetical protein BpHYR1_044993 [Brachionus plicatilis]
MQFFNHMNDKIPGNNLKNWYIYIINFLSNSLIRIYVKKMKNFTNQKSNIFDEFITKEIFQKHEKFYAWQLNVMKNKL